MTIKAKAGVQLCGHVYRKGEIAEYAGAVTQRIADNFTAADGTALVVGAEGEGGGERGDNKPTTTRLGGGVGRDNKPTTARLGGGVGGDNKPTTTRGAAESDEGKILRCVEVMKRDGIMQALDGMNVTYSPKSRTEYLAKLLLMSRGEITE